MLLHEIISTKITYFLDYIYYNNLKKLYNESLNNLFQYCKYPVIKPEFFIYIQFYFIYASLYYKNIIINSISLHLIYICSKIFNKLLLKYDYKPLYNIYFLKDSAYFLFLYLLSLKITFLKIYYINKILLSSILSIFFTLMNINYIYTKRLECIELKKDFTHPLKILIISPSKSYIESVINKTKYCTYGNFLFVINICIYLFS